MKILLRVVGAVLGLLVVLAIAQYVASESGEVVVLTTNDAEGAAHETRVWVVEHDGSTWLRSGGEIQAWYGRLRERPAVHVERDGTRRDYTAVPVPEQQAEINGLMQEKYGFADTFIGWLFGRDDAIPIRLDPRPAGTSPPGDARS